MAWVRGWWQTTIGMVALGLAMVSGVASGYQDNAATLTPDPLYARFYYSHPPAVERLAALSLRSTNPAAP